MFDLIIYILIVGNLAEYVFIAAVLSLILFFGLILAYLTDSVNLSDYLVLNTKHTPIWDVILIFLYCLIIFVLVFLLLILYVLSNFISIAPVLWILFSIAVVGVIMAVGALIF